MTDEQQTHTGSASAEREQSVGNTTAVGFPIHAVAGFLIGVGGLSTARLAGYAAIWAVLWSILRVLGRRNGEQVNYPRGFVVSFLVSFVVALVARWLVSIINTQ